jgi:hypothetical protein
MGADVRWRARARRNRTKNANWSVAASLLSSSSKTMRVAPGGTNWPTSVCAVSDSLAESPAREFAEYRPTTVKPLVSARGGEVDETRSLSLCLALSILDATVFLDVRQRHAERLKRGSRTSSGQTEQPMCARECVLKVTHDAIGTSTGDVWKSGATAHTCVGRSDAALIARSGEVRSGETTIIKTRTVEGRGFRTERAESRAAAQWRRQRAQRRTS